MKKRKVYAGEVHHVYQRTQKKGLLFYSLTDYLVFFTIYCSVARRRGVEVLALCPMPDHIHQVVLATDRVQLIHFEQTYAHLFSWEWNRRRKRKGYLFQHPFGSAAKLGDKQVRTALAYCNNNPVERKLTRKAEDYRWTFLPYYRNTHPYSQSLNPSRCTARLRAVLKEVKNCFDEEGYLRYAQLERWEKHLSAKEWLQLTDYIITLWNVIDYEQAIRYYGSFETMLRAFHDNTGSEFEIPEERDSYSDEVYAQCLRLLLSEGLVKDVMNIPVLPETCKEECRQLLTHRTSARPRQICKLLHLSLPRK